MQRSPEEDKEPSIKYGGATAALGAAAVFAAGLVPERYIPSTNIDLAIYWSGVLVMGKGVFEMGRVTFAKISKSKDNKDHDKDNSKL